MDNKELRSLMEAYNEVYASMEVVEDIEQIDEISANLALAASKEAGKRAGVLAGLSGGDPKVKEKAVKKRKQSERLYALQAKKRVTKISKEEFDWIIDTLLEDGCDLSNYTEQELYDICCEELEIEEGLRTKIGDKVKKHVNQYAYAQGIHNNPGWLRKPEKRAELNKSVRDDIKKNPKAAVKYVAKQVKKKVTGKLPKTGITGTLESLDLDIFDVILEFLQNEGIAEDLNEATWIMSNVLTEEQIDEILGLFEKKKSTVNKGTASEFAGRSMTSTPKKKPYEVISGKYASPMHTVYSYGPKGEYSKKRSAKV
jgi:hypothetical protein